MSALFLRAPSSSLAVRLDPGLLDLADRACLRLLHRAGLATPSQLATLVYPSERTAQRRLRRLWLAGLVERAPILPIRGGIPVAYRLSRAGMRALGYSDRRSGGVGVLRHNLDVVASVCALVRAEPGAVMAWLPESIVDDAGLAPARPDSVVVVQVTSGSGVLCLEIDEATEHAPQIEAKLAVYARVLTGRRGWSVLFVVPTAARLAWLRRIAPASTRAWAVALGDLERSGFDAPVRSLGQPGASSPLRALFADTRQRWCPTPVGSPAWVELLGSGGGEDLDEALS